MSTFNNTEPNLLNGTMSYDKLREKAKYEDSSQTNESIGTMIKKMENYATTQTNFEFDLIANPSKLVAEDDMKLFNTYSHRESDKHHSDKHYSDKSNSSSSRDERSSDHKKSDVNNLLNNQSLGDLMKNNNNTNTNNNHNHNTNPNNYPTPKPSADGPSYGSGQNIPSQVTNNKYEGFANEEELLLNKLTMLRKLGELATQHGVILSQNYSMASSYKSMKYEHELHKDIRDKYNGTKWLGNLLCNLCYGIELGNDYFDPFSVNLKGWSQQMEEDRAEYYDVLAEIYEKYFKSGKPVPPEIKLGFMIFSSAGKFHMQQSMMRKIPNIEDVMAENPELAEKLRQQSQAEKNKIREQNEKQRAIFENTVNKQHDSVVNKINDLNALKRQEQEYMNKMKAHEMQEIQQLHEQQQIFQKQLQDQKEQMKHNEMAQRQILSKQRQLEELQKQLNLQRSDCRSNYTETTNNNNTQSHTQKTMKQPYIPASLQNKFNQNQHQNQIPLNVTSKKKSNPMTEYNNAMNMSMGAGAIMPPETKNNKNKPYNINNDNITIDEDIDNIISRGLETSYDTDSRSKSSIKKTRGRPKKNINNGAGIRINT